MNTNEMAQLEQNLQGLATPPVAGAVPPADESYLTMDNFRRDFGSWLGNDEGLTALFFNQLQSYGVNSESAARAAMMSVLDDTIKQANLLLSKFQGYVTQQQQLAQQQAMQGIELQAQAQQILNNTQNVANAVQSTLAMQEAMNGGDMTQPDGIPIEQQMPSDMPPDMPSPDQPPAEQFPADQPPVDMPPAEPPADQTPPTEDTTSDARVKNIKRPSKLLGRVLSDRRMKTVQPTGTGLSAGIIAACKKGF